MKDHQNSNTSMCKGYHWHGMCEGKNSRIFCGIFLIVFGLFLLGKRANWFPVEFMIMFWPVVFVLTGIWFIALALNKKRPHDQGGIVHDRK